MKDSENIKESDPYNFLLLSLYHYLKKNKGASHLRRPRIALCRIDMA